MNRKARLDALSAFLKAQRAKLLPQSLGLPAGPRRRTPGLRREEVAQLAGVSTTWYTWLEQGRDISVSASVLNSIAAALQLTADERKYLHALAADTAPVPQTAKERAPAIPPSLVRILQELNHCPTIISDRRLHIVGWNQAAAHVFLDFARIPDEERNIIRLLFTRQELRRLAVNWEEFVRGFLAIFRSYYGQYVEDEWYGRFLAMMMETNADFRPLWEQSEVKTAPEVVLEFRHAKVGKMQFRLTSLSVIGEEDLRLSIYTPAEQTATEHKLRELMER